MFNIFTSMLGRSSKCSNNSAATQSEANVSPTSGTTHQVKDNTINLTTAIKITDDIYNNEAHVTPTNETLDSFPRVTGNTISFSSANKNSEDLCEKSSFSPNTVHLTNSDMRKETNDNSASQKQLNHTATQSNLQSTCICDTIEYNAKPFIEQLSSKMRRLHFIIYQTHVIHRERKQFFDICHDIIAVISFLPSAGVAPDDQSHLLIKGATLLQLISNASTNERTCIYYDSKEKQQIEMNQYEKNEFSADEIDAGYAMLNMAML